MKAKTFVKSLVLAAVAVPAFAAMASATPAKATAWLNVRTGPSTAYNVIGTLRPHQAVHVSQCSYSWCAISYQGYQAWVSKHYLNFGYQSPSRYQPTYRRPTNYW